MGIAAEVVEHLRPYGLLPDTGEVNLDLVSGSSLEVHVQVGNLEKAVLIAESDSRSSAKIALTILRRLAYLDDLDLAAWPITAEAGLVLGGEALDDGDIDDRADAYAEPGYTDPTGKGAI